MTRGKFHSVGGAITRGLSLARRWQALEVCQHRVASLGTCDGVESSGLVWSRHASGTAAGGGDAGDNGGSGNPSDKGQWRNWIEQRLKAKEAAKRGLGKEEPSFTSRGSLLQDKLRGTAFSGVQKSATEAQLPVPVVEPMDDFESRVLGISTQNEGEDDDLLRELDEIERSATWRPNAREEEEEMLGDTEDEETEGEMEEETEEEDEEDWDDERGQVLTDTALSAIVEYDLDDEERPYQFRPDRLFFPGQTYDAEDLDLSRKPDELEKAPPRYRRRYETNEVLLRADFRNPRYLSSFISETSKILPKRKSYLSAKAQRKVIREIKTARALGLMPFTSMGQAPFRFLRSRLDDNENPQDLY